jgi:hypothetical protein
VTRLNGNPNDIDIPGARVRQVAGGVSLQANLSADQIPEALLKQVADQIRPMLQFADQNGVRSRGVAQGAIVIQGLDDGPKVIAPKK